MTDGFEPPADLARRVLDDDETELGAWAAALPRVVDELADRWSLQLGPPFQPGGQCSWVAPARDPAGHDLVLKIGWLHDEAAQEAAGLRCWAGSASVLLHRAHAADRTSVLLLERCRPGVPLQLSLPEPEQDVVVASLPDLAHPPRPRSDPQRAGAVPGPAGQRRTARAPLH